MCNISTLKQEKNVIDFEAISNADMINTNATKLDLDGLQ